MSQVQMQAAPRFNNTYFTQNQCRIGGNSNFISGSGPTIRPLVTGRPEQLLSGPVANFPSSPQNAASIVSVQSDIASSVTGQQNQEQGRNVGEDIFRSANFGLGQAGSNLSRLSDLGRAGGRFGRTGGRLGRLSSLGILGPVAGTVGDAYALPGNARKAGQAIAKAWNSGEGKDWVRAGGESASALSTGASLASNTLSVPKWIHDHRTGKVAEKALRDAMPNAPKKVIKAGVEQASKNALGLVDKKTGKQTAVSDAADKAVKKLRGKGKTYAKVVGAPSRKAAESALKKGGKEAAKAATKAAGKGLIKAGAKAGARFVPGLNVAVAAADTAACGAAWADKDASWGKRITSTVTAAGSIAAATNFPGVSQAGAAISAVSSFVGSWFK